MQNEDGTWGLAPTPYENAIVDTNKFMDAVTTLRKMGYLAVVMWTADDVNTIKVNWSREECEEWLATYDSDIQDAMIEHGWEYLHDRLSQFDDRFYIEDTTNDDDSDVVIGHS